MLTLGKANYQLLVLLVDKRLDLTALKGRQWTEDLKGHPLVLFGAFYTWCFYLFIYLRHSLHSLMVRLDWQCWLPNVQLNERMNLKAKVWGSCSCVSEICAICRKHCTIPGNKSNVFPMFQNLQNVNSISYTVTLSWHLLGEPI